MQSHWNIFCRMTVRVEQGKSMEDPAGNANSPGDE